MCNNSLSQKRQVENHVEASRSGNDHNRIVISPWGALLQTLVACEEQPDSLLSVTGSWNA